MNYLIKCCCLLFIALSINMVLEDCGFFNIAFSQQKMTTKTCSNVAKNINHSHMDCFENVNFTCKSKDNLFGQYKSIHYASYSNLNFNNSYLLTIWHPPKIS
ncbi:MAG: hypothetical protein V1773_03935 [bacterium]